MEVHVLHREALASWGERPQTGMHEWTQMRARQGAMTEHLVCLSDLRIDGEMQIWKGCAPGFNDLAYTIQRTGTPKIEEVGREIRADEIQLALIPDLLKLTTDDTLVVLG